MLPARHVACLQLFCEWEQGKCMHALVPQSRSLSGTPVVRGYTSVLGGL